MKTFQLPCDNIFWKLIVTLKVFLSFVAGDIIISSPRVTNWGRWHPWEYCPPGQYVHAFQLQTDRYGGHHYDDTSLDGIKLFCDVLGSHGVSKAISSKVARRRSFGAIFYCDGVMTGFELRSESPQGKRKDDTAANNLRAFCITSDGNKRIEGDGERFGEWTGPKKCLMGQAICGIRTQVEAFASHESDCTTLNNVDMKCCDIKSQITSCTASDAWVPVFECDNSGRNSSTKCRYEVQQGYEKQHSTSESESKQEKIYKNFGFSIGGTFKSVKAALEFQRSSLKQSNHNWKSESSATWSQVTKINGEFEVKPRSTTRVYQVVGYCGPFTVHSYKLKFVDV